MPLHVTEADLAVAVLHLLRRRATPVFGTATRAQPSYLVWVQLGADGPLHPGDQIYFPMQVEHDVWEKVVYPTLLDDRLQADVPLNRDAQADRQMGADSLLGTIQLVLREYLIANGYRLPEAT